MTELYQQDWKCPVCDKPVKQSGKGRPKEYHPRCREINNLMGFMETKVSDWPKDDKDQHMKSWIKSNLQRIANLTNSKEWSK